MRTRWACALFLLSGLESVTTQSAERVTVRVVDPAGKRAMAGAGLSCLDPAGPGATVGADGRLSVLGACKRVRCWAEGYLPGEAAVDQTTVDCRIKGAVTLGGSVRGLESIEGMEVRLYAAGSEVPAAREKLVAAVDPAGSPRHLVGPVETGRYRLEIVRVADGWTCRAQLGALAHGAHSVDASWRPPVTVRGRVSNAEGQPVAGITIRAVRRLPSYTMAQDRRLSEIPEPVGAWSCGAPVAYEKRTPADGNFSLPADPEDSLVLAAGEWGDGLGVAAATFARAPREPVTLRPRQPVQLSAQLVYDDDRPAACRGALGVHSPEANLLARLIPGAAMEARCAADGAIRLGPFLDSDWEVNFRPEPGLPLLMRGAAPAAGATEALGRLVVDRGVTLLVDVVDPAGAPIEGARVFGSGSAGVVIGVEATTDRDGRAELVGLAGGSSLTVEVSSEGFLSTTREGIDAGPKPVRIELKRGAALEGRTVDTSGEPVRQAEVRAFSESSRASAGATSGDDGAFRIDGAEAGRTKVMANAGGYGRAEPVAVDLVAGETRSGILIELPAARGVRGRVVDASGQPVAAARVALSHDRDLSIDAWAAAIAQSDTDDEGRFSLTAEPNPMQWVSVRARGHAAAVVSAAPAVAGEEIEIALPAAGAVEVRFAAPVALTRAVVVTDGAKQRHVAVALGRESILFEGLAAGSGAAGMPPGEPKQVEIVEGATAVVELREGATLEGTVTHEGRPLPRYLVAILVAPESGLGMPHTLETDARGAWSSENLAPGSYLVSAVGEQGRAERRVEVPRDGIVRVDLAVTSVIAEVHVRNARSGEPVTAGTVTIVPAGANCQSSIGRSQPASAERNGLSLRVSDGGCGLGELDAQGRARVALDAPGPHTVMLDIKRHRSLRQEIDLGTGTNVVELALTPEGAPVVRVRLHSDPPGLTGTLDCIQAQGQARSSYGGVSGTVDCGTFRPGPAEVIFRIDGFGLGRTALEVPEDGDIEVAVTAVRGGQLLLGGRADAAARPIVLDPSGLDWGGVLTRSGSGAIEAIDSPEVGPAWLLRYLPPGEYAVSLGGSSRGVVFIDPGSTTVVP